MTSSVPQSPRVLARFSGAPGPTLIVLGGLHGNEPSGVAAQHRVAAALAPGTIPLRGDLILVVGNVGALELGVRFVDHDLNRGWTAERLSALRTARTETMDAEDREQLELAQVLEQTLGSARGPGYLLDLHATSAAGIPFTMCRDTPRARTLASAVPLTLVLGLLEAVGSTLATHFDDRCVAVAMEGGQNADPASERNHEAAIWLMLVAAGLVGEHALPDLAAHRENLSRARGDLPRMLRVDRRHAIGPADRFEMEPGYANIQRIAKNELLAHDRGGEIRASEPGFILMPLYQAKGDDGFFLGREVHREELRLS
jgi:succinylglutamate desuccinylase